MPGLTVSTHAWVDCSGERFVVYNTKKPSQVCEIHFVWSCPIWPSRWGMRISIDWLRLKSCYTVCDECTRGEICSGLSRDAGCLAMWSWRESHVTDIWGSGHDHGFVLFLFTTTGFHIAWSGIFYPNIRVIRGPYCTYNLSLSIHEKLGRGPHRPLNMMTQLCHVGPSQQITHCHHHHCEVIREIKHVKHHADEVRVYPSWMLTNQMWDRTEHSLYYMICSQSEVISKEREIK